MLIILNSRQLCKRYSISLFYRKFNHNTPDNPRRSSRPRITRKITEIKTSPYRRQNLNLQFSAKLDINQIDDYGNRSDDYGRALRDLLTPLPEKTILALKSCFFQNLSNLKSFILDGSIWSINDIPAISMYESACSDLLVGNSILLVFNCIQSFLDNGKSYLSIHSFEKKNLMEILINMLGWDSCFRTFFYGKKKSTFETILFHLIRLSHEDRCSELKNLEYFLRKNRFVPRDSLRIKCELRNTRSRSVQKK